ncbi:MAG: family 43 glycosylhydrolase [Clostridia bacterium]|nr:family 43 glycosylhydrolase [Clostridia bacterium]
MVLLQSYKKEGENNPLYTQRFGADPGVMEYGGRLYVYMTDDLIQRDSLGNVQENTYGSIRCLNCISSDDLVNWTDHGRIAVAGAGGAAPWARNSWAPCAAHKQIDGQEKFFLYYCNGGNGIGVLTADSPTGPWEDPLKGLLISRATPNCADVTWLFDPAVMVDDDGTGYLAFGGGVPEGKQAAPGTGRIVRLGDDMISLAGDPVALDVPWLFEDSGINKFGSTYVYSYCSNFSVPASGSAQGFQSGEIVYLTSDSPMGPFAFGGRVLQNPGALFGVGGNNHHCMFSFKGQTYITYHAATVDKAMGWGAGYRSTFIDVLNLNEQGLPAFSKGTYEGVAQVKPFDPFRAVPAATLASLAGAETVPGAGGMIVKSTSAGGWIGISGADFGQEGAGAVKLTFTAPENAKIEILLDSPDGAPAAVIGLPAASEAKSGLFSLPETVKGVHDLYFRFTQAGVQLLSWQFFSPIQGQ